MGVHVFPILNPPPHPTPLGHPSAQAPSTLYHASNLGWRSVSHMIIYMFQCYSLKSCHPHLLPQSPKDCYLHLCLFCCLAYRVTSVVSDSLQPHRRQPTRLPHPWDSPGKNTGVGCHFLFQCMRVKSEGEGTQSCPTLRDPHRL